jgi:hypothetical protein
MKTPRRLTIVLALCGSLLLAVVVLAAPAATTLDRNVIGGGGGHAEAGLYALDGTIGQSVVRLAATATFDLCSGFWCGRYALYYQYLPLVTRSHTP